MALYMIQGSYTPQTWAGFVKNPHDRREAVRPMIESLGGKLEDIWFAFGGHDFFALASMPDNVSAAAVALAVTSSGAMSSYTTTVLMTMEEAIAAARKAAGVSYRPPA